MRGDYMMRLSFLTAAFVVVAVLLLAPVTLAQQTKDKESAQGGVVGVDIQDNYLEPADIDVTPGTTVMWINRGQNPHSITAENELFASGPLNPGETYWVTFNGQGKVTYLSSPEMIGTINVGEGGDEEDTNAAKEVPASANGADGGGTGGADGR